MLHDFPLRCLAFAMSKTGSLVIGGTQSGPLQKIYAVNKIEPKLFSPLTLNPRGSSSTLDFLSLQH